MFKGLDVPLTLVPSAVSVVTELLFAALMAGVLTLTLRKAIASPTEADQASDGG